jgi:hypothetical protein
MGSGTIQVPDLSLQPRARAPPSGRRRPLAPKQIYLCVTPPTANSEEAKNDRAQRDMLLAATNIDISDLSSYCQKFKDEVTWISKRCNNVEEARNNALHSPFVLMHSGVQPGYHMGHERATKLAKQQDVLTELRWCRDAAKVLSDYVQAIDRALEDARHTWPDRPKWPTREDTKRKTRRHPAGQSGH